MSKMRENNPNKEGAAAQGGGSPRPVRGRAPSGALGVGVGVGLRLRLGSWPMRLQPWLGPHLAVVAAVHAALG